MEDMNKGRRIFLSLSKLDCVPQEINSREIVLHLTFSANWNKRDKLWKTRIQVNSDVFAAVAVAVVDAKAPYCDGVGEGGGGVGELSIGAVLSAPSNMCIPVFTMF